MSRTRAPEAPVEETEPAPVTDAEIMAAVNAEMARTQAAYSEPKRVTVSELFQQAVALVASATGKSFRNGVPIVSETSAVKLYELTLMWALNNRSGTPSHDILPGEGGEGEPVPTELPIPNEIIGGTPASEE